MNDETKQALEALKAKYEAEAVWEKKTADEDWRQHEQRSRAQACNATLLWCANEINKVLAG